jgi:hypothetical protein
LLVVGFLLYAAVAAAEGSIVVLVVD